MPRRIVSNHLPNEISRLSPLNITTIQKTLELDPYMVWMTALEAYSYHPAAVFPCSPVWPVPTSPKLLLLLKVMTWLSLATEQDGGARTCVTKS